MRMFTDGETITVEPFRSAAFPIVKDCVIDRSALDRIIQAGGYVSVNTGSAPEAASVPVAKEDADRAFAAAACIGCGACVAAGLYGGPGICTEGCLGFGDCAAVCPKNVGLDNIARLNRAYLKATVLSETP